MISPSNSILETARTIHLVGFKGVAMTSIAQCLYDMGKKLSGSDVAEDFVTAELLSKLPLTVQIGFSAAHLPKQCDLVIYTAAHKGPENPEVLAAIERGIPTLSQAEALGVLFNSKQGIAVCGVGGKSTTSFMIVWLLTQLGEPVSYSVGVGQSRLLPNTGRLDVQSKYFIAEADEYVTDPSAPASNRPITPRFSYLRPSYLICTFLAFDHPDVYRDFAHTQQVFLSFFHQIKPNGVLLINADQPELIQLSHQLKKSRPDIKIMTFGTHPGSDARLLDITTSQAFSQAKIQIKHHVFDNPIRIPGRHNLFNAAAALLLLDSLGLDVFKAIVALNEDYKTIRRRFEFIGEKNSVLFYDDYAHHPREIEAMITNIRSMFPDRNVYVVFQPHTFSRTKALFHEFVDALSKADHLILMPIFGSDREGKDPSISSDLLAQAVSKKNSKIHVQMIGSFDKLSNFCTQLSPSSVVITLGAGDVYQVHDKILNKDLT